MWLVAALATLTAILAIGGWRLLRDGAGESAATGTRAGRWTGPPLNLLLVTLDTARADRLGCYGYARARTRHMDRLAAEGVRFAQAISPAPITLPAHATILTGLYPFEHGVRNNGNFYLGDGFDTLATRLREKGYRTAAFVSSFILDRRYGLARGFDLYDDRIDSGAGQVVALEAERRGDVTALALGAWLDGLGSPPGQATSGGDAAGASAASARNGGPTRDAPFFAWLHLYDPHEPYRPPPPFREAFADSPYDGELAFDDAIVASVVDRLSRLGLIDRTLIAIVGDHGESLGDHGEETHSMFVYESALRVPFILWRPGLLPAGQVVEGPVRLTDLAPTLIELLGARPIDAPHGRSLVSLAAGGPPGDFPPVYAETLLPELYMNWAPLYAVRDERWKLVDAPRPELYDLAEDPGELENVHDQRPQTAQALGRELEKFRAGGAGAFAAGRIDRDALDRLAALGYVGAGAEPAANPSGTPGVSGATEVGGPDTGGSAPPDPKDFIGVFNRLRRANSAVRERRFGEALPILREVLERDPRNAFAQLVLGSAFMGMERYPEAIAQYRAYLALVPTSTYAHLWLAICHLRVGDQDAALREADAALAIDAKYADARVIRAGVLASRGRHGEAIDELRAAIATDPAKVVLRLDLARVLAEAGRAGEARTEYERILEIQGDFVPALVGLGALLAEAGELAGAEATLRRAVAIDGRPSEARLNLARVLAATGRVAEARTELERVVASPTATPTARREARARLAALRQAAGGRR